MYSYMPLVVPCDLASFAGSPTCVSKVSPWMSSKTRTPNEYVDQIQVQRGDWPQGQCEQHRAAGPAAEMTCHQLRSGKAACPCPAKSSVVRFAKAASRLLWMLVQTGQQALV